MQWIRGKLIGKGSYGRVYLALNATTGEIMAVKQVEIPKTASDRVDSRQMEVLESLKSESEMLKTVGEHPNIVQYLGIEESADYMSIFLEYVPGGTLRTLLTNRGRFDDLYVRYFTKQILTGLAFLHSKGVVHRDLKSDNILIEPDGVCKISDFGISKTPQDPNAKLFTEMKGTIFWMAPEVLGSRRRGYNCKVDIWSIGCIALEMWSGVRPWDGEELVPVMMKLYQGSSAPPLPSGIELCEEALNFRSKCFTVAPEERPSAAELERHPYLVIPPHWTF
ncbi:kinase-like protein, partial [Fistulina hepatica ATCC 64428]